MDCLRILTTGNDANKVALFSIPAAMPALVRLMGSEDQVLPHCYLRCAIAAGKSVQHTSEPATACHQWGSFEAWLLVCKLVCEDECRVGTRMHSSLHTTPILSLCTS